MRPYQAAMIDRARVLIRNKVRRVLIQSATGSGKTCLSATMIGGASQRNLSCWFLVPRIELVDQSSETFSECDLRHGIIAAGYTPDPRQQVHVGSVATVARRLDRLAPPKMIVWDEAHHVAAASWASIFNRYPDAIHIGLSATPRRLDGTGLRGFFDDIICGPSVSDLIEQGWLAPYRYFEPSTIDVSALHTRAGDYVQAEAEALIDKPTITGSAIAEYKRHCDGARAVVFAVSIAHSQHICEQFRSAGVSAAHLDGKTERHERKRIIDDFRAGRVSVLTNVGLVSEGFDLPAMEAAILLRPTQSEAMFLQQVGRALRPCAGKTHAVILDHVGNRLRHGLPDDEREWSLDGRDKRKPRNNEAPIRSCPQCFATLPAASSSCPCGYVFTAADRTVQQVEGELAEVDQSNARRKRVQFADDRKQAARTLQGLIEYGRRQGYSKPEAWAQHVWDSKQKRRATA